MTIKLSFTQLSLSRVRFVSPNKHANILCKFITRSNYFVCSSNNDTLLTSRLFILLIILNRLSPLIITAIITKFFNIIFSSFVLNLSLY